MTYPFHNAELPIEERVDNLLSLLTVEEKLGMLTACHQPVERLGLKRCPFGVEIARGHVSRDPKRPTTVLPQPIGLAATFDAPLLERLGHMAGVETRIISRMRAREKDLSPSNGLMPFGPTVDMARSPLWGRNEECYGEDPYLTGVMAGAYTRGLRGGGKTAMTAPALKHFAANNNEKSRTSSDSQITPRAMREYYYEAFRRPLTEGGAMGVMTSYNRISGVPAICSPDVRDILAGEWGMMFALSDGGDFVDNVAVHRDYNTHAESLSAALRAGVTIMLDRETAVVKAARDAMERRLLSEAELDEAIKPSLRLRFSLGEFDPDDAFSDIDERLLCSEEHRQLNRQAALEQLCLLTNDGFLPLDGNAKTVAVIGAVGGRSYMDWYTGYSAYSVTVVDGLKKLLGDGSVLYDDGFDRVALRDRASGKYVDVKEDGSVFASSSEPRELVLEDWGFGAICLRDPKTGLLFQRTRDGEIAATAESTLSWIVHPRINVARDRNGLLLRAVDGSVITAGDDGRLITQPYPSGASRFDIVTLSSAAERVAKLAGGVDAVIVCVGNDPMINGREEEDRPSLRLPDKQSALVKAASDANRNTALVVISSYPYAIGDEEALVRATLHSSHAGPEMGAAIAMALTGRYNPSGRLPQTWYASDMSLCDMLDYDIIGHGQTYMYSADMPLHPFGYGLSYSDFAYEGLRAVLVGEAIRIEGTIRNLSERDGDEVIEVYYRAISPSVKRPHKQLCAFERVSVPARGSAAFTLFVPLDCLRFWDVSRGRYVTERGDYELMAGSGSADIRWRTTLYIDGETVPPRDMTKATAAFDCDGCENMRFEYDYELERRFLRASEGGSATFANVAASECPVLWCYACNAGMDDDISVEADGDELGRLTMPTASGMTDFTWQAVPLNRAIREGARLTVRLPRHAALMELRLGDVDFNSFG